jgi:hypothetical protein
MAKVGTLTSLKGLKCHTYLLVCLSHTCEVKTLYQDPMACLFLSTENSQLSGTQCASENNVQSRI